MCGIAGVLSRNTLPTKQLLKAMAHTLAHRGPDGEDVHVSGPCGLAHRRLSIIDLSPGAAQPMTVEKSELWIVFNGEIYNFKALRAQLENLGRTFKTQGDTEVILHGYLQWGEAVFSKLDGMFAIALWDAKKKQLILARDRTGKKPLYVYEDDVRLVFASEIKAILVHPDLQLRENPEAVAQFLSAGYVPTPSTFYARIRKLHPATYEVFDFKKNGSREVQYWDFPIGNEREIKTESQLQDACGELRHLFFEAVEKRMISDVPLGAFLSGGIDSTLVVAAMAKASSSPVRTFSIGFEGFPEWDETKYARLVAERYGTQHTEFKVKPESFDLVEKLAWHYDEPFGDSSAIPSYIVSKLTREAGVTVALTGDGGDELFAGYPRFMAAVWAEKIPKLLRSATRRLVAPLPHGESHSSTWERGRRFAQSAARDLPERLRAWVSVVPPEEIEDILAEGPLRFASRSLLNESYELNFHKAKKAQVLNQVLYANARTYLLDDLNVKMDRASMAASLETRAPFLDTQLMEFAFSLPASVKIRGKTTKWIVKEAFKDLLPDEVVNRKKMGFGVPLGAWFRGGLEESLSQAIAHPTADVRADTVQAWWREHQSGKRDRGLQLWALLQLTYFRERTSQVPSPP
jgi:asparagine synthase (glutamine-hydrolysing)